MAKVEVLDNTIEKQNEACVRGYVRTVLAGLERVGENDMGYVPGHAAMAFHAAVDALKKAVELMDKKPEDITAKAAEKFVELLAEMGPVTMQQIAKRNAEETSPLVCHTHDFCDANMVMSEALGVAMGTGDVVPSEDDEATIELWNAAWEIAKKRIEETYLIK